MYTYTKFSARVYLISYTCILNSVYAYTKFHIHGFLFTLKYCLKKNALTCFI